MNWQSGFRRAFILLAIAWAIFALVIAPPMARHSDYNEFLSALDNCKSDVGENLKEGVAQRGAAEIYKVCVDAAEMSLSIRTKEHSVGSWLTFEEGRLWLLLGFVLLPPWAAYGLFHLGWLAAAWVSRGFRQRAN